MATLNEIKQAIRTYGNANEDSWEGDANEFAEAIESSWRQDPATAELPGIGIATYVDSEGGGEGGTEAMTLVFRVGDNLYRIEGTYDSYDSDRWYANSLQAVVPVEKTIIVYETVE